MNDARYYSLNTYLRQTFGEKVYRLSLNGGMTCPNRDGSIGTGGCIFCSAGGSGDFAASPQQSVTGQIAQAKLLLREKTNCRKYIAYFQAYTNTYAPVGVLRALYTEALAQPDIVALSIATRCDCLPPDVLDLLAELNTIKPVWVELGLQTIHEHTLRFIRSGFSLAQYEQAVSALHARGIKVITHLILGLPGETKEDVEETIRRVQELGPDSLTVHSLAIKRASRLSQWILEHGISTLHNTDETMAIAAQGAKQMGMEPYYLYRQKNMSGNFENVGYAKPGKAGIYNILIMEEVQTIMALGAGTISKRVYGDGRIERCDNVKDVGQYIERIDEMIQRKQQLFSEE
mgnify:CR=1 FL=1